jgi:hypothetical protein
VIIWGLKKDSLYSMNYPVVAKTRYISPLKKIVVTQGRWPFGKLCNFGHFFLIIQGDNFFGYARFLRNSLCMPKHRLGFSSDDFLPKASHTGASSRLG